MSSARLSIEWVERDPPLSPTAVVGVDDVAKPLAVTTRRAVERGAYLAVACSPDATLVIGPGDELPWADGVIYLALVDDVLVPTHVRPDPQALVLRAMRSRLANGEIGVLLQDRHLISSAPTSPVDVGSLSRWAVDR